MKIYSNGQNVSLIYLAGGCFWGVEGYFKKIDGILETEVGYANGKSKSPNYKDVCSGNTGHAETVKLKYDRTKISIEEVLLHYLRIINPYSVNKQGNDIGIQYRTGIYYVDDITKQKVSSFIKNLPNSNEFVVEILPLDNFYPAEEYHQDYLDKNPNGYCHINLELANKPIFDSNYTPEEYFIENEHDKEEALIRLIGNNSYQITQHSATEMAYTGKYNDNWEEGIYVDVVTGEPLFRSTDKFESGCGWPSFSRPITWESIEYKKDNSHGMTRIETVSKSGNSHLGHVFHDGPESLGGLRYCINSGALKFIPKSEMTKKGYSKYLPLLNE